MAIPVSKIQEGCCDNDLSSYNIIDGDSLDSVGSTCDKIIECSDKYILVEEKSLLFGFFHLCLKELNIDLESYKFYDNGTQHLKISEIITAIQSLNRDIKERILAENITNLLYTSLKKVSNTTHILSTQRDSNKTHNMQIFYLYCKSGKPIDRIMNNYLSKNRKNIFIECNDLKSYLQNKSDCENTN